MHAGKNYSLKEVILWTRRDIFIWPLAWIVKSKAADENEAGEGCEQGKEASSFTGQLIAVENGDDQCSQAQDHEISHLGGALNNFYVNCTCCHDLQLPIPKIPTSMAMSCTCNLKEVLNHWPSLIEICGFA